MPPGAGPQQPADSSSLFTGGQLDPAILKAMQDKVKSFCMQFIYLDVDPEKTVQLSQARMSHLYWEGYQYLYPDILNGQIVDYRQVPTVGSSNSFNLFPNDYANRGMYDGVLNYIYGDGNKFVAVLGSRAPNPKALALCQENEDQFQRARRADRLLQGLRKLWPVDQVQRQLALFAWKDGTFFLHTPWEVDGKRYGTTPIQLVGSKDVPMPSQWKCLQCGQTSDSQSEQCPTCGSDVMMEMPQEPLTVPTDEGTIHVENGAPGLYPETIFTTTVPFYSRNLLDAPWLWFEYEVPKGPMLDRYPELESEIESDAYADVATGISQQAILARSVQANTFGRTYTNKQNRWLYSEIYLKPETYNLFGKQKVDIPGMGQQVIKDFLKQLFPRGTKLILVARKLVDMQAIPLEDEWSFGKPGVSPYIYCHPVSRAALPIQDMINEQFNLFRETVERNIPYILGDPTVINFEEMRKRAGVPGEIIPTLPSSSGKLADSLYKGPTATIEPEVERWVQNLVATMREITGVLPPIFGGGEGSQTALEAEQKRTQALMALALPWFGMRDAWKGAYSNAIKAIVRHGAQALQRFGLKEDELQDLGDLLDHDGNLNGYTVDIEEGIPITWGALRDAVMGLIQLNNPEAWQLTGLTNPANAHRVQDALGMTDWTTPGSSIRDYVLDSVRVLLTGAPILGAPDPMTGQPVFQAADANGKAIPINDFAADGSVVIPVLQEWMLSDEAKRIRNSGTQDAGWQNVLAWGMAWKRLLMQQAMPTPAAMPPPPQGGGGGAPLSVPAPQPPNEAPPPPNAPPAQG